MLLVLNILFLVLLQIRLLCFYLLRHLFAEINAYHSDLVEYAHRKRVWICSPTTLISTFTVIEVLLKNMERDKYTSIIHDELNKLGVEFSKI